MNEPKYIIVNNHKILCTEIYRKSISRNYLFSKKTVPCLLTFNNIKLSKTFTNKMCHYNFEEICLTDYDNDVKELTSDHRFTMYKNVELRGFLKQKNNIEDMKIIKINKEYSKKIDNLINTQSLFLYEINSFKLYTNEDTKLTLSINGIILEPNIKIHDDDHLQIVKNYLDSYIHS